MNRGAKFAAIGAIVLVAALKLAPWHPAAEFQSPKRRGDVRSLRDEIAMPRRGAESQLAQVSLRTEIHGPAAGSDPVALIACLRRLVSTGAASAGVDEFGHELELLAAADPDSAAMFAAALEPGFVREWAFRIVAHQWTKTDCGAALAWASGLPDPTERTRTLEDVILQVAAVRPRDALENADRYHLDASGELMGNLAVTWAQADPVAALEWSEHLPSSERREVMIARIALVIAEHDPRTAAQLVRREIPEGPTRSNAELSLAQTWGATDPVGATAWLNSFSNSPLRSRAQQELLKMFSRDLSP